MSKFTRDCRLLQSHDGKLYGTRIVWLLCGEHGVIEFMLRFDRHGLIEPWDIGYHAFRQPNNWATHMDACDLSPTGECWYDGTSLRAEEVWKQALAEGGDVIWRELEDWYADTFARSDDPPPAPFAYEGFGR